MRFPVLPPDRYPLFDKLIFGTFVLLVPFGLGSAKAIFDDGDVSWHLATGQWILAHGQVPRRDPFSFTMAGEPWVPHEWLADVIYALAFDLAGYSGLAAIVTLVLIALHLIVFLHLRGTVGPIGIFLSILALDLVLGPFILARPHVLIWPLLALWTVVLLNSSKTRRSPPLWIALLMVIWVNLHGSFVLGFIIYGALALEALFAGRWSRSLLKGWFYAGALSLAATLLNANGIAGLLHPFAITGMEALPHIEEWQPSSVDNIPLFFGILLLTIAGLLMNGVRVPSWRLALLLVMLAMAFMQVRHASWLATVAVLILPPLMARSHRAAAPEIFESRGVQRAWLAATAAAVTVLLIFRLVMPLSPREGAANPTGLIAAVPDRLKSSPVLNDYSFGGPLILAGIRPYIDGRADMYGDEFFERYRAIVEGNLDGFERAVQRHGIRWTMLHKGRDRLIEALDTSPRWRRLYSDEVGVIHIRDAAEQTGRRQAVELAQADF